VCSKADLDAVVKKKFPAPAGTRTPPIIQPVAQLYQETVDSNSVFLQYSFIYK